MITQENTRKNSSVAAPRWGLHPDFVRAVRDSDRPLWALAVLAGYTGNQELSKILCAGEVKATPLTIGRMQHIADIVGFPRERVFSEQPLTTAANVEGAR